MSGMPRHRLSIIGIPWSCETPMEKRIDRHDAAIGAGCSGSASRYRKAEVHWRLLAGLVARSIRGAAFVFSDDHAGLRAERRIVLGATPAFAATDPGSAAGSTSPPTPFTTSDAGIKKRIGAEPRNIWTAVTLAKAEAALDERVAACRYPASAPATWLENIVPDGLQQPRAVRHRRAGHARRQDVRGRHRHAEPLGEQDRRGGDQFR